MDVNPLFHCSSQSKLWDNQTRSEVEEETLGSRRLVTELACRVISIVWFRGIFWEWNAFIKTLDFTVMWKVTQATLLGDKECQWFVQDPELEINWKCLQRMKKKDKRQMKLFPLTWRHRGGSPPRIYWDSVIMGPLQFIRSVFLKMILKSICCLGITLLMNGLILEAIKMPHYLKLGLLKYLSVLRRGQFTW